MSNISKRRKDGSRAKIKTMGDHKEFLKRITKTLYYGELPTLPCLSLPVTEISCAAWSEAQRGRSLRRLHADAAARVARSACVSPCALVLAILYLERLKRCNADYLCATSPADLFLVSLMVSNKFLQDDGEDDEVICSEWAASGGLDLAQLKKLEVEFLNAIDWNVFVSDKSFEAGLQWLERQVALRQAQSRGFFTYTDLTATCDAALVAAIARDAILGLTAIVALLTSAAVLLLAHSVAKATIPSNISTSTPLETPQIPSPLPNATAETQTYDTLYGFNEDPLPTGFDCCNQWSKYQETTETKRNWFDALVLYDWKSFEPWWSKTSVMNWLYQSSLITPMQRWLEKINLYAEFLSKEVHISSLPQRQDGCGSGARFSERRCVRQWLNLSKLSVFVASVSDR
ncbi:protein CNPPD1 [Maniola jurtina]|uniref:protein CNPPD1 n=1 Tax=Maniola jurtina TaxID=191418 RepID=UPI001E686F4A|nr:protein CNPPD1 [Maniola jurtina]